MPKIFISYRREDSKHAVGRLHSALKRHVRNPKRDIFMDIDNIPRGVDFVEYLDGQVAQCDVMLAVIGPSWLSATDSKTGERRLDDPDDFVRIEIASALKRGIPVVPVVLDDTGIPIAADLPEDLKALARRNGERLEHESFESDVKRLIRNLPSPRAKAADVATNDAARAAPTHFRIAWPIAFLVIGLLVLGGGSWAWLTRQSGLRKEHQVAAGQSPSHLPSLGNPIEPTGAAPPAAARQAVTPATPNSPSPSSSRSVAATRRAGESFRDCSSCPEMVVIPSGSFLMGSPAGEVERSADEGPQRWVEVVSFAVGKYEVTWEEYDRCVAAGTCSVAPDDSSAKGRRPVSNVTWTEARTYSDWLSGQTGLRYRLLSEAEWEYAARAGTTSPWSWGEDANRGCAYSNGADMAAKRELDSWVTSTCDDGVGKRSSSVGTYKANAFGLFDTHGNVAEWVEDCYSDTYSAGQPADGSVYSKDPCARRVIRGGSWSDDPKYIRSASRLRSEPAERSRSLGFRVAQTLP